MAAETIPDAESTINFFEGQFNADPHVTPAPTMLDILGIEMSPPENNDLPLAPTATGYTDYVTKKGDSF